MHHAYAFLSELHQEGLPLIFLLSFLGLAAEVVLLLHVSGGLLLEQLVVALGGGVGHGHNSVNLLVVADVVAGLRVLERAPAAAAARAAHAPGKVKGKQGQQFPRDVFPLFLA